MTAELDDNLTSDQWQALKALRAGAPQRPALKQSAIEALIARELAAMNENQPVITSRGRKVLVRGSPCLWDVVA